MTVIRTGWTSHDQDMDRLLFDVPWYVHGDPRYSGRGASLPTIQNALGSLLRR
jgi:hypothetical protein